MARGVWILFCFHFASCLISNSSPHQLEMFGFIIFTVVWNRSNVVGIGDCLRFFCFYKPILAYLRMTLLLTNKSQGSTLLVQLLGTITKKYGFLQKLIDLRYSLALFRTDSSGMLLAFTIPEISSRKLRLLC